MRAQFRISGPTSPLGREREKLLGERERLPAGLPLHKSISDVGWRPLDSIYGERRVSRDCGPVCQADCCAVRSDATTSRHCQVVIQAVTIKRIMEDNTFTQSTDQSLSNYQEILNSTICAEDFIWDTL